MQMWQLIEEVSDDLQTREVTMASEKEARGLRSKFYQFLGACKRDVQNEPKWLDEKDLKAIKAFLPKFMSVEIRLEGNKVIFRSRDNSPLTDVFNSVKIITEERYNVPPTEQSGELSPAEESAMRMMEKQEMMAAAKKKLSGE
jgi:hypothetical protein